MDINMKHVAACYEAWRRKKDYEGRLAEYEKKTGLSRLLSARPRDPFRGVSLGDLSECVSSAFKGAFPKLAYSVEDERGVRLGAREWRTDLVVTPAGDLHLMGRGSDNVRNLFSEESFESKKGYGFIHEYQHDSDPKKDNSNRQYAHAHAMDSRFGGPFFEHCYRELDAFRSCPDARMMMDGNGRWKDASLRELRGYVSDALAYRDHDHAMSKSRSDRLYAMQEKHTVTSHRQYIENLYTMASLSGKVYGYGASANDRMEWSAAHSCNLYSVPYLTLLQEKQRQVHDSVPLPVILDTADRLSSMKGFAGLGEGDGIRTFVRLAYLEGHSEQEVASFLGEDRADRKMLKDVFDKVSAEQKALVTREVEAYANSRQGRDGLSTLKDFPSALPCVEYAGIVSRLDRSESAADWLRVKRDHGMELRPETIGRAVYKQFENQEDRERLLSRIGDIYDLSYTNKGAADVLKGRLLDGFKDALAEDYVYRNEYPQTYSKCYPGMEVPSESFANRAIMAQQLDGVASGLMSGMEVPETAMDSRKTLRNFLYDAGVTFEPGESPKSALLRASSKLVCYHEPDGKRTKADTFREKWADLIRRHPAKREKKAESKVKKVEKAQKTGLKR